MEYDNTNRGALFSNKRKTSGDKKPDYTGELDVAGTAHWVSAWLAKSKNGESYMQLALTPKEPPMQQDNNPHQVYQQDGDPGFRDLETDPERPF
jgi:hypothetical protein